MQDQPPKRPSQLQEIEALQGHLDRAEWIDAALLSQRLGRIEHAAVLFERANRLGEACECWLEAQQYERAIEAAVKVPRRHALHRPSALVAFRAALALGVRDSRLDRWAEALEEAGCVDTADLQLFEARRAYCASEPGPELTFSETAVVHTHGGRDVGALLKPGDLYAGRYRIARTLGIGASATVFVALDEALDDRVALKVMRGPLPTDSMARLRREIQLARRLTHDCIVRVYDLIVDGDLLAISMEMVEGASLSSHLEKGPLPLKIAANFALQAAKALTFAHERGVVHRDVKPDNMLITTKGELKIADFGVAKSMHDPSITRTGSVLGTPYYIAPEQIADSRAVDHRADIYALGAVTYCLFTGRVPFDADSVLEVLGMHLSAQPELPSRRRPGLPAQLDAMILEMLAKDPDKRTQSCQRVVELLTRISLS